jgi:small ligand-binding sensory domain FIST
MATDLALAQALGAPSASAEPATLGFVYLSASLADHFQAIVTLLRQRTGVEHWAGGVGFGVLASGAEYLDQPAIAIMLAPLPAATFRMFCGNAPISRALAAAGDAAWQAHSALVHADPSSADLPQMIADLSQQLGVEPGLGAAGAKVFGGILGGDAQHPAHVADHVLHGGLSGVIFGRSIQIRSALTQGCAPLGAVHRISQCQGQYLQALDGQPALDVMLKDLGVAKEHADSRDGDVLMRSLPADRLRRGLLVGLDTDSTSSRNVRPIGFGEYQVRNLIGIDPQNRLLAVAGDLQLGARAVFCTRDQHAARADLIRVCTQLRDELESESLTIRGALYFSCVARGRNLFGNDGAEMQIIGHNFGDIPLIGMFANGEICGPRMYGYTGVLSLFVH